MRVPAVLYLADGRTFACHTENYSVSGLGLLLPEALALGKNALVWIGLKRGEQEFSFAARVALCQGERLGLRLEELTQEAEMHLMQCTFGRADAWVRWDEDEQEDQPIQALKEVILLGLRGYRFLARHIVDAVLAWMFPPVSRRRPGE
jgi:cellulose synthase (UDP-forming)